MDIELTVVEGLPQTAVTFRAELEDGAIVNALMPRQVWEAHGSPTAARLVAPDPEPSADPEPPEDPVAEEPVDEEPVEGPAPE